MPKYIVTCLVTVEGVDESEAVTVGVSSPTTDYHPNRVVRTVEDQYRMKYPGKKVAVVIHHKNEASNEEYLTASLGFIEIKPGKA
jgi:hypothetical protein